MNSNTTLPISKLTQNHIALVGQSAVSLNRLMHLQLPVLTGFVIPPQFAYYYQEANQLSDDRITQIIQSYSQISPQLNQSLLLTSLNQAHDLSIPTYDLADSESTLIDSLYRLWDIHAGASILVQLVPDLKYSGIALYQQSATGTRHAKVWINRGFWHPTEIASADNLLVNLETHQVISREYRESQYFSQVQGSRLVTKQSPDQDPLSPDFEKELINLVTNVNKYAHEFNFLHFVASPDNISIQSLEQANFHDMLALEQLYDKKKVTKPLARGLSLSQGAVSGPLHYLSANSQVDSSLEQSIVAAHSITPSQITNLPRGLITQDTHYNQEIAIFARYHRIPMISVSDFNSFTYLIEGQTVVIDGHLGTLTLPQYDLPDTTQIAKTKAQILLQANNLVLEPDSSGIYMPLSSVWSSLMGLTDSQARSNNIKNISSRLSELLVTQSLMQESPLLIEPTIFSNEYVDAELYAIRAARKHVSNLHLVIPPLATLEQFKTTKKQLYYYGLKRSASFKFYLHVTAPSVVWHLSEFASDGLDGIVINIDRLISALSGDSDRGDIHDPHILGIIEQLVTSTVNNLRLDCYIQGDTVIYDPDIVQKIIKWGVTGIIVTPDRLVSISHDIARNEVNISKNKHRLNKRKK